jgi:PAS domain S-box-containing protein
MASHPPTGFPILTSAQVADLIIEHARDYAIFTLDREGRITSWSKGSVRVLGFTEDEAIGMNFATIFTASDRAAGQDRVELEKCWREGRAEDTRWHVRRNGERFWANGVTTAFRHGALEGFIKVIRDETRARNAEEQRVLLLNELNHRINNTLVTVQSLIEQTLRTTDVDRGVRENLTARLLALSEAHKLLVAQNWAGADLREIVERALAPFGRESGLRFESTNPPVRLSPAQAVSVSLILHELATNAVKYGALSTPEGHVAVAWNLHVDEEGLRHITLLWEERGGPAVSAPTRTGFGSRLIARSLGDEAAGHAHLEFAPAGVRCAITLPLPATGESRIIDLVGELESASSARATPSRADG